MSMGFLNPENRPIVWRGPMLHGVIQQFLRGVDWGQLDYLIVDLPPGTGDVQLSLLQTVPISGAVVVTTPSDVSLEDARKAVLMFRQVKSEVLGMVENMSYLLAPQSGERIDVFGCGGGKQTALEMDVPFLGELPLDPQVRIGGDTGSPIALRNGSDTAAAAYHSLAKAVIERIRQTGGPSGPSISIED
jgi:ATP-binding protein involved in chromosome partitioning